MTPLATCFCVHGLGVASSAPCGIAWDGDPGGPVEKDLLTKREDPRQLKSLRSFTKNINHKHHKTIQSKHPKRFPQPIRPSKNSIPTKIAGLGIQLQAVEPLLRLWSRLLLRTENRGRNRRLLFWGERRTLPEAKRRPGSLWLCNF